jgi:aspartyl-tRNA(Asn)/glutamyl-tRNA(Gln) amidotransferase subunit C
MKVEVATVRRLAELSKLSFSENEEKDMVDGLNEMIAFVDKLKEMDTANIEPLVFMTEETNVLREDVVEAPISQADALRNAPSKDMYYFRVPKVIKQ